MAEQDQNPDAPKPPTPEQVQKRQQERRISETTTLTDRPKDTPLKESELRG